MWHAVNEVLSEKLLPSRPICKIIRFFLKKRFKNIANEAQIKVEGRKVYMRTKNLLNQKQGTRVLKSLYHYTYLKYQ